MAFIFEVVPEKDREFFKSMKLMNCWGNHALDLPQDKKWCADRERNAYLVGIGGGHNEMPYFYDLWWDGYTIRMEVSEAGNGNYETGVNIIWNIWKIPICENLWQRKDEIINIIVDAFSVFSGWCNPKRLNSIAVDIKCEPEIVKVTDFAKRNR